MNYLKIYCQLIRHAQANNNDLDKGEYEKHHVFPQAIFGENDFTVKLTFRQHLIAHMLIAKACAKRYGLYHSYTRKMNIAVHRMVFSAKGKQMIKNSFMFEAAKKAARDARLGVATITEQSIERKRIREQLIAQGKPVPPEYRQRYQSRKDKSQYKDARKRMSREQLYQQAVQQAAATTTQTELQRSMTDEQFDQWVKSHDLKVGGRWGVTRPNPNIVRALVVRQIPLNRYYKESDYSKSWFDQRIHQVIFYGL